MRMTLSTEQQSQIENSLWVVNSVLKKRNLSYDEDMRQSAILYMCECILRFDPSLNIKWTTYAYKNIDYFVWKKSKEETANNSYISTHDIYEYKDIIQQPEPEQDKITYLKAIYGTCNEQERKILDLKKDGYSPKEISQIMNFSISTLNSRLRNIRARAKDLEIYQD